MYIFVSSPPDISGSLSEKLVCPRVSSLVCSIFFASLAASLGSNLRDGLGKNSVLSVLTSLAFIKLMGFSSLILSFNFSDSSKFSALSSGFSDGFCDSSDSSCDSSCDSSKSSNGICNSLGSIDSFFDSLGDSSDSSGISFDSSDISSDSLGISSDSSCDLSIKLSNEKGFSLLSINSPKPSIYSVV